MTHQARPGLLRRLGSWAASSSDQPAPDSQPDGEADGSSSIAEAPDRERVRLSGTLRTVSLRPRGGVPALEAELDDGTGSISLVWLGRRRITGIGPGREVTVEGRIGVQDNVRVMFNPRYELRP